MKLWTVQPLSVIEQLEQGQTYSCDEFQCEWKDIKEYQQAYQWMADQLEKRVGNPPKGVKYPLWAWHTVYGKHQAPDLRKSMFRKYEDPRVCIELEIPDEQVLLSDYDTWQEVLKDEYIDYSFYKEEYELERARYEALTENEQRKLKLESWDRVFGIMPYKTNWRRIGFLVQGCFWEIKPEYIRSVRNLRPKGK